MRLKGRELLPLTAVVPSCALPVPVYGASEGVSDPAWLALLRAPRNSSVLGSPSLAGVPPPPQGSGSASRVDSMRDNGGEIGLSWASVRCSPFPASEGVTLKPCVHAGSWRVGRSWAGRLESGRRAPALERGAHPSMPGRGSGTSSLACPGSSIARCGTSPASSTHALALRR